MIFRSIVRHSALAAIAAVTLLSASTIARAFNQEPAKQTEASLLTAGDAIPDVDVVLKKKPDEQPAAAPATRAFGRLRSAPPAKPSEKPVGQSAGSKKTNKDGSFSFENVPVGTYNFAFDPPKVSPAMAGKVEYLVILEQVEVGNANNSATQTYDESKAKTARIPIAKIKDGLDITVGPQPQGTVFQASKSNTRNSPGVTDSQMRKPKESPQGNSPQAMNLRGKIFLVEIGTTRIVRDNRE